jgi:hypothetical protein
VIKVSEEAVDTCIGQDAADGLRPLIKIAERRHCGCRPPYHDPTPRNREELGEHFTAMLRDPREEVRMLETL